VVTHTGRELVYVGSATYGPVTKVRSPNTVQFMRFSSIYHYTTLACF